MSACIAQAEQCWSGRVIRQKVGFSPLVWFTFEGCFFLRAFFVWAFFGCGLAPTVGLVPPPPSPKLGSLPYDGRPGSRMEQGRGPRAGSDSHCIGEPALIVQYQHSANDFVVLMPCILKPEPTGVRRTPLEGCRHGLGVGFQDGSCTLNCTTAASAWSQAPSLVCRSWALQRQRSILWMVSSPPASGRLCGQVPPDALLVVLYGNLAP